MKKERIWAWLMVDSNKGYKIIKRNSTTARGITAYAVMFCRKPRTKREMEEAFLISECLSLTSGRAHVHGMHGWPGADY